MGVCELESYINKFISNGTKSVNIGDEIKAFEKDHGLRPLLIFDVMSLVGLLCRDVETTLCGGRFEIYMQILEDLFRRLSGAELIFFVDGYVKDSKRATWENRQKRKYNNQIAIMDQVYSGIPLLDIAKRFRPIHVNTVLNVIEEACKTFGQLMYAVDFECDQEIARYAFMNKRVLGIFSNDSDFMIFRGEWRYFSTKDIKLDTLETKEFDRLALRKHFNLNDLQLAIFSTIAGNDFLRQEDLNSFHLRFDYKIKIKFPKLAAFIRKISKTAENREMLLKVLAKEVFGNTKEKRIQQLERSIDSYTVHSDIESTSHELLRRHNLFTFNILNGFPLNFSVAFFDFRYRDMPSFYDLCVPMLQRQAGIIFLLSSTPDARIEIYIKQSHQGKQSKYLLPPNIPPAEVPDLETFYSDDPTYDGLRLMLLKWSVDWNKLKSFYIEDFPENYMIDILTITFMVEKCVITPKEADVFLWVIKNVENKTVPQGLQPPEHIDSRPFRLAFLYVKLFTNVARSIEVCGLKKKYMKPCNFDGVFFHHEYKRFSVENFDIYKLLNEL